MKKLEHGQLLDARLIMDGPMGILSDLDELVPKALHWKLKDVISQFESELAHSDVSDRYEEVK